MIKPKIYYFAKQNLKYYADTKEPSLYPHAFEEMVKKSDYDREEKLAELHCKRADEFAAKLKIALCELHDALDNDRLVVALERINADNVQDSPTTASGEPLWEEIAEDIMRPLGLTQSVLPDEMRLECRDKVVMALQKHFTKSHHSEHLVNALEKLEAGILGMFGASSISFEQDVKELGLEIIRKALNPTSQHRAQPGESK